MATTKVDSPWAPLRHRTFRALWIATLVSNLGTWMQSVGSAWLMTSLTSSPLMVAMVQAAASGPVFLIGFAAGAAADVVSRRRLLLLTQTWMLLAVSALSITVFFGLVSARLLLGLTFAIGVGAAMTGPAWQATVSELVPNEELVSAVSLNSAGFNLARATGPAIAGVILARAGAGTVFLINAISFLGVLWVLCRWQEPQHVSALPHERLGGAMRAGIRYLRNDSSLRRVLARTILFAVPASALWALLPLTAKSASGGGPSTYGILLAGLGIGALLGAWYLPRLKKKLDLENLITIGTIAFGVGTFGAATWPQITALFISMLIGGVGWLIILASLNAAARMRVPSWIEARALASYLIAFQGSITLGSLLWGAVASVVGLRNTLLAAAAFLILTIAARACYELDSTESLDLRPAKAWPEPNLVRGVGVWSAHVLVIVEYEVKSDCSQAFLEALEGLGTVRRREGAFQWSVFVNVSDPSKHTEQFMVESWVEHLRQHQRNTVSDHRLQQSLVPFLTAPPGVSHHIAARLGRKGKESRSP